MNRREAIDAASADFLKALKAAGIPVAAGTQVSVTFPGGTEYRVTAVNDGTSLAKSLDRRFDAGRYEKSMEATRLEHLAEITGERDIAREYRSRADKLKEELKS